MPEKNTAKNKLKLTDTVVRTAGAPVDERDYFIWDTEAPGFGVRVHKSSKSYVLHTRLRSGEKAGQRVRLKIGDVRVFPSVRDARRAAQDMLLKITAGGDPVAEKAEAKRRAVSTVAKLLDRYEKHLARRQYVVAKDVMSVLRRRLAPFLDREISMISGWEYVEIIEQLEEAGQPGAVSFRARCTTFLNWCTFEARVLDANPLAGYRRKRNTRAERVAKAETGRALSGDELKAVWHTAAADTSFGRLVRFLILTGCRRNEAAMLRRDMMNLDARRIDLPATFTKQARGHTVYISEQLVEVLGACDVDARDPGLVFPSARSGGPIKGWSKIMDRNDALTKGGTTNRKPGFVVRSGVDFSLHDLRRTFRTGLSQLGVDRDIAELALGHARADLEARYNRDDCETALREAFAAWGWKVASLVAPVESIFD